MATKNPARIPSSIRKRREITPDAPPAPTEHILSPETVALGLWIDAEDARLLEEKSRAEAALEQHQKAIQAIQEGLGQIAFQGHMVAASRHAREDSLRKHYGVDERWRVQGDKLVLVQA